MQTNVWHRKKILILCVALWLDGRKNYGDKFLMVGRKNTTN